MATAAALDPDVAGWIDSLVFGDIWARPHLEIDERRLVAISMLAAGGHLSQLGNYIHGALQAGVAREKLLEVLVMGVPYLGFPKTLAALGVLKDACAAEDRAVDRSA
jgi:4-carboxymuconolactone decarboxylase